MAKIDFGGVLEEVITVEEFSLAKARDVLKDETIAVIGYGVQGPGQSLNMKDNGINVIVGQAKEFKEDWDRAASDGWGYSNCERGHAAGRRAKNVGYEQIVIARTVSRDRRQREHIARCAGNTATVDEIGAVSAPLIHKR